MNAFKCEINLKKKKVMQCLKLNEQKERFYSFDRFKH